MSSRRSKSVRPAAPSNRRSAVRLSPKGLQFDRVFSDPAVAPFDQVEWVLRTAEITDDTGKAIFKQEDIEVPAGVVGAGDENRRLEVFLRRRREGHRSLQGRP